MEEIEELKNTQIKYPANETWFICWNNERNEIKAHGSISINQVIGTNWQEIDYYSKKEAWAQCLLSNGIVIEEDETLTNIDESWLE